MSALGQQRTLVSSIQHRSRQCDGVDNVDSRITNSRAGDSDMTLIERVKIRSSKLHSDTASEYLFRKKEYRAFVDSLRRVYALGNTALCCERLRNMGRPMTLRALESFDFWRRRSRRMRRALPVALKKTRRSLKTRRAKRPMCASPRDPLLGWESLARPVDC